MARGGGVESVKTTRRGDTFRGGGWGGGRSKKNNTRKASWAAERRRCRSCGTRHSLLEPIAVHSAKRSPTELPVGLSLHQSRAKNNTPANVAGVEAPPVPVKL